MYVFVCNVYIGMHYIGAYMPWYTHGTEDILQESVRYIHSVGHWDQTQVVRVGSKCHVASP